MSKRALYAVKKAAGDAAQGNEDTKLLDNTVVDGKNKISSRRGGRYLKRTLSEVLIEDSNFSAETSSSTGSPFVTLKEKQRRLAQQTKRLKDSSFNSQRRMKKQVVNAVFSVSNENNKIVGTTNLRRLASTSTAEILNQQAIFSRRTPSNTSKLLKTIIQSTKGSEPWDCNKFFRSPTFIQDFIKICHCCNAIFKRESRVLNLKSPLYVLGDIHGNLEDLRFFGNTLWPLGINLMGGAALFMGDYVDRGMKSVEVVCYLLARKVMYPKKVYLLRGNHETQEINTWLQQYRRRSFLAQCVLKFGVMEGRRLCYEINRTFAHMPFAATIDDEIFCVHGGIPRPEEALSKLGVASRIAQINMIPCPINVQSPGVYNYDSEDDDLTGLDIDQGGNEINGLGDLKDLKDLNSAHRATADGNNENLDKIEKKANLEKYFQRLAFNLLWADPATDEQETALKLDDAEFMRGRRGEYSIVYGTKAVETFLEETGLSMIMRAHEATQQGVKLCKHAQVMTIFSTSKNHGRVGASCACVFVDLEKIYVINKSVAGDMSRSFSNLMDDDYDEVLEQYEGNAPEMAESEKYKNIPEMGKIEEGEEEEEEEEDQQDGSLATEEADENDMHLLSCEETISYA